MTSVDNFKIGAGSLSIDGADIGYTTEEGVVVTYEPDVHLHLSGKYGTTPVKASLVGMNLTLEVWMAENTLANLEKAMAGAFLDGSVVKFGGVAGTEITGAELVLTPFDGSPTWTFKNAVAISPVEVAYKVNDERIMQVTFRAMVDTTATENENVAKFS